MLLSSHRKHAHSTLQWRILRGAKGDSEHTRFWAINYQLNLFACFPFWSVEPNGPEKSELVWFEWALKNYAEWRFLVTVQSRETVSIWTREADHCHCAVWGLKELALYKSLKPNFLPMERWLESMPRWLWGGTHVQVALIGPKGLPRWRRSGRREGKGKE